AEQSQENAARLLGDCAPEALLLRIHALVGETQRLGRLAGFTRDANSAVGGADREPLTVDGERLCSTLDEHVEREARLAASHQAELVAAHPVRPSGAGGGQRLEVSAEPGEQRVARGVTEAVVVLLEAVQVEQHEKAVRAVAAEA